MSGMEKQTFQTPASSSSCSKTANAPVFQLYMTVEAVSSDIAITCPDIVIGFMGRIFCGWNVSGFSRTGTEGISQI